MAASSLCANRRPFASVANPDSSRSAPGSFHSEAGVTEYARSPMPIVVGSSATTEAVAEAVASASSATARQRGSAKVVIVPEIPARQEREERTVQLCPVVDHPED